MKNKLIKETSWGFASKGAAFLLYFGINIYLARKLGVQKFGLWSFFFSIFTIILSVSSLGVNIAIKKFIAQHLTDGSLSKVLSDSIKIRTTITFLFSFLLAITSGLIANLVGKPEISSFLLLASTLILFSGILEFLKNVFEGLHRIKYNFILNFLEYGIKLLLIVIVFQFSRQITNIISIYIIATLVSAFIGFYILYKNYLQPKKSEVDFTKKILKYSVPLFVINIGFVVSTELDTFLLGVLSSNEQVGIFAAVKQLVNKIPHIATAIAMGTMPVFANMDKKNIKKLNFLFNKLMKFISLILGAIVIFLIIFAPYLVPLILGEEYRGSIYPLQILSVYAFMFSLSVIISNFLNYRGLAKKRVRNLMITLVLNIGLNLLLIPKYGAVGAAFGTTASYFPYVYLNYLEAKDELNKYHE